VIEYDFFRARARGKAALAATPIDTAALGAACDDMNRVLGTLVSRCQHRADIWPDILQEPAELLVEWSLILGQPQFAADVVTRLRSMAPDAAWLTAIEARLGAGGGQ